jgi:hypothetical protein
MSKALNTPTRRIPVLTWQVLTPLALVLIVATAAIGMWMRQAPAPIPAPGTMPVSPAIEEKWGVRITQLGLTAAGGLLDMRYVIIDPDKAQAMMGRLDTLPVIVAADGTKTSLQKPMSHKGELEIGRTYYILYVNKKGAIKYNETASIIIGDLHLDNVPIR